MNQAQPKPRRLDPPAIKAELARIAALSAAGKFAEAETKARALQSAAPQRGDVNDALALTLSDQRKLHDALPFAKAAVAAEPRNAAFLVNLGRLHIDLEQIEFAAPILEKAYRFDAGVYQAPWALAAFYYRIGQGGRAVPYFDQALLRASPEDRPLILEDYGRCLAAIGDAEAAEKIAGELLPHERFRVEALCALADLRKHDLSSPMAEQLRAELDRPEIPPKQRSNLLLALGRIHENSGDYAEAFRHFSMSRQLLTPATDKAAIAKEVSDLLAHYTPEVFERFRGYGHPSDVPVFVVGMPRSGTTLAEQIIAAHPDAAGVGELFRIGRMNRNLSGPKGSLGLFEKMTAAGPERWQQVPEDYLRLLTFLAPGAKRAVDKMPHNFMRLGFIHLCFPKARIVNCIRHPADCFISAFQNRMNARHGYAYDQLSYAENYADYQSLMRHWKTLMPEAIFDLRYEELATDPEPVVRSLLAFLGLDWDERCLSPHETQSTVRTMSRMQVRKPINASSVGRWKNYARELQPLLDFFSSGARSPRPSNSGPR